MRTQPGHHEPKAEKAMNWQMQARKTEASECMFGHTRGEGSTLSC